jgi:hypothetical protein
LTVYGDDDLYFDTAEYKLNILIKYEMLKHSETYRTRFFSNDDDLSGQNTATEGNVTILQIDRIHIPIQIYRERSANNTERT